MHRFGSGFVPLLFATVLAGERLPVRVYSTTDGLAGISVHKIVPDSHGFLWFCTGEGLSRFDGYQFTSFGTADGLPEPNVYDLLETREDIYWVATAAGLSRFNPRIVPSAPRFQVYRPASQSASWINVLEEENKDAIWAATTAGLFLFRRALGASDWTFEPIEFGSPDRAPSDRRVSALLRDRRGQLWIGAVSGLYLRRPNGATQRYSTEQGLPSNAVTSLMEDSQGRVWVGTDHGLCRLAENSRQHERLVSRRYTVADGLPADLVRAVIEVSSSRLWIGTRGGLAELVDMSDNAAKPIRGFEVGQGLSDGDILTLAQDRDRNLWVGTNSGGAFKIADGGFITYGREDGLRSTDVMVMFEDRTGSVCAVTKSPGRLYINRFNGKRFVGVSLNVGPDFYPSTWMGWHQVVVESRDGEWWAASQVGLLRFPRIDQFTKLASTAPIRRYGIADGLAGNRIHQVFEDSRGHLWISTREPEGNGLTRWDPVSQCFSRLSEANGLPSFKTMRANGFFEDRAGQIWIGLHREGVLRYVRGRFETFRPSDGLPAGGIRRFHQDRQGRLWLGSGLGGLARVDHPESDRPAFVTYSTADGLSSNEIQAITEDRAGRIYIGSGHGLDRLDPATGRVRRFTTADGLAAGEVQTALCDREGNIWVGTVQGVSRLVPESEAPVAPTQTRVMDLRIAGDHYPLHSNGEVNLEVPDLPSNRNQVQIDFVGLSFAPGDTLRYQYQLEGIDQQWSQPTRQRSVIYASLNPGNYRFLVRAVNFDGIDGTEGYHVTGTFSSMEEALDRIGANLPDVVLVDIGLPGISGIDGIRLLKERYAKLHCLVLTVFDDDRRVFEAICAGAYGYLLKRTPPARLLEAIREIGQGGAPMSPEIARQVIDLFRAARPPEGADYRLTPHELRLLKLLVEGHTYRSAAAEIGLTVHAVSFHTRRIYEKLQVHSKSEAVSKALRSRIV